MCAVRLHQLRVVVASLGGCRARNARLGRVEVRGLRCYELAATTQVDPLEPSGHPTLLPSMTEDEPGAGQREQAHAEPTCGDSAAATRVGHERPRNITHLDQERIAASSASTPRGREIEPRTDLVTADRLSVEPGKTTQSGSSLPRSKSAEAGWPSGLRVALSFKSIRYWF